jgi:sister-chromatid-cohesion protein PDS5
MGSLLQKRKQDDAEGQPSSKKAKSEPRVKVARTPVAKKVKEKKSPKVKKQVLSTPVASSDRRRSGRGASAKKSYADRDDGEVRLYKENGVTNTDLYRMRKK